MSAIRMRATKKTLAAATLIAVIGLAGAETTAAGFTDSTFGRASLVTSSGLESPPVNVDQSAASSVFVSARGDLYVSGYRGTGDGNGSLSVAPTAEPTRVAFPDGVRIVDAAGSTNDFHAPWADTTSFMALDAGGGVWTWGRPYGGEKLIGRGGISRADSAHAGRVIRTDGGGELPPIASIARIENQFLALDGDGVMWAWGYGGENLPNPAGAASAALPFAVRATTAVPSAWPCTGPSNLGEVAWRSIWGGTNSAGAVGRNGLVYTWGFDTTDGLSGVTVNARCPALNEGANRALFQRYPESYTTADGLVYDEARLPDDTQRHERYLAIVEHTRERVLPACDGSKGSALVDDSGCPVRQLGFSAGAARLLTSGGELLTWLTKAGYGEQFLGRTPSASEPAGRPAPVAGSLSIDRVTAGVSSLLALSGDGIAYGWGANNACQAVGAPTNWGRIVAGGCSSAGGPTAVNRVDLPVPVAGLPGERPVTSIASTQCASWARSADGSMWAWGAGTVAGYAFNQCVVPAKALQGYKIYRYDEAAPETPFGAPVSDSAAGTVQVLR